MDWTLPLIAKRAAVSLVVDSHFHQSCVYLFFLYMSMVYFCIFLDFFVSLSTQPVLRELWGITTATTDAAPAST